VTGEQERISAYREWLTEQAEKDEADHREGLSPLPRLKYERLAIYLNLPKGARRRFVAWRASAKSHLSVTEKKLLFLP